MAEEDTTFESSAQDNTPEEDPLVKLGTDTPLGESVPMPDTTAPAAMAPPIPAVIAPESPQKEPANTNVPTFEEYAAEQQKSVPTFEEYSAQEQHPIGTAIHDRFQTDEGWTSFNPANRKLLESVSWENIGKESSTAAEVTAKSLTAFGIAFGTALVTQPESHIDKDISEPIEALFSKDDYRKIQFDHQSSLVDIAIDLNHNFGRTLALVGVGTAEMAAEFGVEMLDAPVRAVVAGLAPIIGEGPAEALPEVAMAVGLGMHGIAVPKIAKRADFMRKANALMVPNPILKATAVGLFDDVAAGTKIPPERMKVIDEAHEATAEPVPLAVPVKPIEAHVQDVLAERGMPDLLNDRNKLEGRKEMLINSYSQLRDERNNAAQESSPYLELIQDNEKRLAAAVEPKTKKMLQGRIDDLTDQHEAWIEEHTKEETPIMKAASAKLLDINDKLMTMASEGHIREAYKEAQKRMPAEEVTAPAAEIPKAAEHIVATPFNPDVVEEKAKEQDDIFTAATKQAEAEKNAGRDDQFSRDKARAAEKAAADMRAAKSEEEFNKIVDEAHAADVATQKINIIAHRTKMLRDAGMELEQAKAAADLEAAHYASRAARFEGLEGTAEEMYHRDAALVKSAEAIKAESTAAKKKAFEGRNEVYAAARKEPKKPSAKAQGSLEVGKKGKKAKAGFTPIQNFLKKIGVKINDANEIVSGDSKLVASEFNNALEEHGIRNPGGDKAGEFVDHDWLSEQIANEKAGKGAMTEEQSIADAKARNISEIRNTIGKLGLDIKKMSDAEIDEALHKYLTEDHPTDKAEMEVHDELVDLFQEKISDIPRDGDKYFNDEALSRAKKQSDKSREKLIYMTPDEFLSMAAEGYEKSKETTVKGALKSKEKFKDVPLLSFEIDENGNGKVTSHEGRHRARALKELGIESMPVRFHSNEGGGKAIRWGSQHEGSFDRVESWPEKLTGEGRKSNAITFPVEDIRNAPEVYQKNLGKIRLATADTKALITLFKDNNASTIIHESMGHHYFDELMRDAENPNAPQQLRDDAKAMMDWSGIKSREAPKGKKELSAWTKAHEKVARGAERYMMEGVAPNKELAGVFAKFKKWFEEIYQTIKLRGQITPEVRAVFDRMMSHKAEDTVIAPEHEAGGMIARVHEADVKTIPPEEKDTARDNIEKEAELTAQKHNAEIADGLTNADKIEEIPSEAEVPTEGVAGAGPAESRQGAGKEPNKVADGGGGARAGRAGVRAEPADGGPAESVGPHTILEPGESKFVDKAGNIRLDNLNAEEDAKQLFRELAERNQDFMPQRGGVISDIRRKEMADALGLKPDNFDPRVPEGVSPSVWAEAVQKVLFQALDDLTAKAKAFEESGTTENDVAFIQARQRFLMIAKPFSTITAESGRTQRVFNKANLEFTKNVASLLDDETGMDLFQRQRQAKMFTELETQSKKAKMAQDGEKISRLGKILGGITEIRINFMLSGPITHVKNMAGNTLVAVNSIAESALTSVVGTILRSEERVGLNESKARLFGLFQGAQDGLSVAGKILRDEENIVGAHTVENFKPIVPGKIGELIRIPTKLLSAEDEIFKAIGYRQELNALAYRDATSRGLTGDAFTNRVADLINDPTEDMVVKAKEMAEYQTFTNPLGPTGRAIQNFANSHFLAKLIVPFFRTPANIAKYAGERSPFGLLSKEIRDNLSGKNGEIVRDRQIARMALGSTLGVLAMKWFLEGTLTGGGPSDSAKKAQLMAEGWRPYSIRIGDMYYSYEWWDPMATMLGVSADMAETAQKGVKDDESYAKLSAMVVASISKNLISKLSLRGASELALVVSDPDRYGDKYIQTLVGSFVPSIIGQAARLSDPVQREANDVLETLKSKIPVLRESLKPRVDVWGNDIVDQGALGPDVISPIRESAFTNDPVNQRLQKLGIAVGKVKKEIHGVKLSDDQYDDFRRIAGKRTKIMLDKVISQPGFSQIPSVNQIKFIRSVVTAERKNASILIMQRYPEIMIQATENKRLELQR